MAGQPLPITHPRLQQLYAYWSTKKGQRKMPSRADIDVLDLRYVMGNMMLVDVIDGSPPRFRIRLHGSNLSQRAGYELTGKMLDELPETDFRKEVRERWTEVAVTGGRVCRLRRSSTALISENMPKPPRTAVFPFPDTS